MGNDTNEYTIKSGVKLTQSKIQNIDFVIPECCRENWDTCSHKLKEPEKVQYNPV